VSRVLIFSDNQTLVNLWTTALSSIFQIDTVDDIYAELSADAVIIDIHKIENDENLLSVFSKKSIRVLIIGSNWSEEKQINALVHGASGYCGESEPPELLIQAIKSILKGDIWIQRHLVPRVIGILVQMKSPTVEKPKSTESLKLLETLSDRELDVAKMIRSGNSNKLIASKLNISERTVKAHLTSTFKKLNVPDRLHLALFIKEHI